MTKPMSPEWIAELREMAQCVRNGNVIDECLDEIVRLRAAQCKALECLTHRDQKPSWPSVRAAISFLRGER